MKRVLTVILTVCLCFALSLSALADVIWEPEDAFYQKHRDECRYENRTYIASGEGGYAGVHKDPKTAKVKEELPNGTEFWVSYVWKGDGGWALGLNTRWVPMSELTVKYDGVSFDEEHSAEYLSPEGGEVLSLRDYGCMQLWTYPGDKEPFACFRWTGEEAQLSGPIEDLSFYTV